MIRDITKVRIKSVGLIKENIKLAWILFQILILLLVIITTVNWSKEIIPEIKVVSVDFCLLNEDGMTPQEVIDMEAEYGVVIFPEVM